MQTVRSESTLNSASHTFISPWMVPEDVLDNTSANNNNNNNNSSNNNSCACGNFSAETSVEKSKTCIQSKFDELSKQCHVIYNKPIENRCNSQHLSDGSRFDTQYENRCLSNGCESQRILMQQRDVQDWIASLSSKQPKSLPHSASESQALNVSAALSATCSQNMLTGCNNNPESDTDAKCVVANDSLPAPITTTDFKGREKSGSLSSPPANENPTSYVLPSPVSAPYSCSDEVLRTLELCSVSDKLTLGPNEVDSRPWCNDFSRGHSSSSFISSPSSRSSSLSRLLSSSPTSTISFSDDLSSNSVPFSPPPLMPATLIPKPDLVKAGSPDTVPLTPSQILIANSNSAASDMSVSCEQNPALFSCSSSPNMATNSCVPYVPPFQPSSHELTPTRKGYETDSYHGDLVSDTLFPTNSNRASSDILQRAISDSSTVSTDLEQKPNGNFLNPLHDSKACYHKQISPGTAIHPRISPRIRKLSEEKDALLVTAEVNPAKTSPRLSRRDAFNQTSKALTTKDSSNSNRWEKDSGCETSGSLSDATTVESVSEASPISTATASREMSPSSEINHAPTFSLSEDIDTGLRKGEVEKFEPAGDEQVDQFLSVPKGGCGFKSQSDVDSDEDSEELQRLDRQRSSTPHLPHSLCSYNPYPREFSPPPSSLAKRAGSQWRRPSVKKRGKISRLYTDDDEQWNKKFTSAYKGLRMSIPDPSDQRLQWSKPPLSVLIIRKHLDSSVLVPFRDLVIWLVEEKSMLVYVEQKALEESNLLEDKDFAKVQHKLKPFKEEVDDLTDKVDFIICLGGDGTLLYVSSLFQGSVPPVMAFNMGSLGFLTPFQFSQDFKQEVSRVMQGSAPLLLRYRLKCVVMRHETEETNRNVPHVKNIQKEHKLLKTHKLVLNDVVLDRGSSSYLSNLDLYIEGRRVTTVQGDGLIISTPTGSTAYAVSAGASMIHPSVPCILLTPICPHSLSFRPIVVPAGVEIKLMLNPHSRGTAMVSFDGRDRQEIHQGDSLRITTAAYPVPSICGGDQIEDWFDGLAVCLNWNIRAQQRPLQRNPSLTSLGSIDSTTDLLNFSNGSLLGSSNSSKNSSEDKNSNNNNSNSSSGRSGSAGERKNSGKAEGKLSGHSRKPSNHRVTE